MHAPPVALEVIADFLPVSMLTPAIQKSWLRGVCRSNQTVLPSQLHHSWPLISMSIVRLCISRIWLPSVRIVHVRSSSCQVPSWQYSRRLRIDGIELQVIQVAVLKSGFVRSPVFRSVNMKD